MAKMDIQIEKAKGGGYILWRDGELAFAASTLPELYSELGHALRTSYGEGVMLPHATVQRRMDDEVEAPATRPSRRPPEVPGEKPASSYSVPNPRPAVAELLREQTERINGHSTGFGIPATG